MDNDLTDKLAEKSTLKKPNLVKRVFIWFGLLADPNSSNESYSPTEQTALPQDRRTIYHDLPQVTIGPGMSYDGRPGTYIGAGLVITPDGTKSGFKI